MAMLNTPLYDEHVGLRAVMGPFAGWNMPIRYGSILEEARHTRIAASIFDTSHMGEFLVREDPGSSLDHVLTVRASGMENKRCKYGFLLNQNGTIRDDLIVYRKTVDEWMLVVNAGTQEGDYGFIAEMLSSDADLENISARTVKIDVQGPRSLEILEPLAGKGIGSLSYYGFDFFELFSSTCVISRTGYTGETGLEVYIDAEKGAELWRALMENPVVRPAGLGARDILRLEMGYPLYGSELTEDITPIESGMERFLDMDRDFNGREALIELKKRGVTKRLVGFLADGRRTPRHGNRIIAQGKEAGYVTSGVYSPHLNRGIGMGYIHAGAGGEGTILIDADRGEIEARIVRTPFLKNRTS
jgi:aminomethyltransferase